MGGEAVGDVVLHRPKTLAAGASLADVADVLTDDHVHLVLLTDGPLLVGTLDRDDLARGLRRLAVVDEAGRLEGLLCLKRTATGFCSDRDVASRARERPSAPGAAIADASSRRPSED